MFNISDSGRRNTVNLGAFGHICTLTLQWYKIRFYGPYQTNRLNLRYIWEDAPHSVWGKIDLESDIACRRLAMLIWTPDWWNVASCKCSTWTGILSCGGGKAKAVSYRWHENEIGGLDFHFMKRNVSSQAKRSFPKKPEFKTPENSTGAHDRSMWFK